MLQIVGCRTKPPGGENPTSLALFFFFLIIPPSQRGHRHQHPHPPLDSPSRSTLANAPLRHHRRIPTQAPVPRRSSRNGTAGYSVHTGQAGSRLQSRLQTPHTHPSHTSIKVSAERGTTRPSIHPPSPSTQPRGKGQGRLGAQAPATTAPSGLNTAPSAELAQAGKVRRSRRGATRYQARYVERERGEGHSRSDRAAPAVGKKGWARLEIQVEAAPHESYESHRLVRSTRDRLVPAGIETSSGNICEIINTRQERTRPAILALHRHLGTELWRPRVAYRGERPAAPRAPILAGARPGPSVPGALCLPSNVHKLYAVDNWRQKSNPGPERAGSFSGDRATRYLSSAADDVSLDQLRRSPPIAPRSGAEGWGPAALLGPSSLPHPWENPRLVQVWGCRRRPPSTHRVPCAPSGSPVTPVGH